MTKIANFYEKCVQFDFYIEGREFGIKSYYFDVYIGERFFSIIEENILGDLRFAVFIQPCLKILII